MMQPQVLLLDIVVSLVIGFLGRDKTLKFWGHFLLSLILTPLAGLIALGIEEWFVVRRKDVVKCELEEKKELLAKLAALDAKIAFDSKAAKTA